MWDEIMNLAFSCIFTLFEIVMFCGIFFCIFILDNSLAYLVAGERKGLVKLLPPSSTK